MAESKDKKLREDYKIAEEKKALENKKRRKKRRRQRKLFAVLFLILLIMCSLLIFIKTPLFQIDKIEVSGNSLVKSEEIIAYSGLSLGDNIFNHTSSYNEKRIIKMPYISKVEVKKKYPSEIIINVTEEDVFGAIAFLDRIVAFDKYGKSIKELTDEEAENLLIFKGLDNENFEPGEYVSFADMDKTDTFFRCLKYITDYDLKNISLIDIEDTKDIYFIIGRGLKVKIGTLGTDDEFSYKMAYIKEVLNSLPQNVSGVIDATNLESGVSYRTEEEAYAPPQEEEVTEGEEAEAETAEEGEDGG